MRQDETVRHFRDAFIARTKQARMRAGLTQHQIALLLGVNQDTYKQWETRSPLPHQHVEAFCAATRITEKWLFTGKIRREAAE